MSRALFVAVGVIAAALSTTAYLPANTHVELDKGQRLAEQGDIQGAIAAYGEVVAAKPDWAEAHARLGGMQLIGQAYGDAVQSFQAAIRLGDSGVRAFVGMGMAYLHMGQYQAARAALLEAKARGATRSQDIDRVLVWLDGRVGQAHQPLSTQME